MNAEVFIKNVQARCKELNTSPTAACAKSGAGKNLISNMKNGENPGIRRVTLLAAYLGCSVSDLTGEQKEPATVSGDGQAEKLANALDEIGIDVDSLSDDEIKRIARLAKASLEE